MQRLAAILVALALMATAAGAASAKTYCVTSPSPPPSCAGTTEDSLYNALGDADADTSGSDLIVLPAGAQTSPAFPYVYTGSVPIEIDGQGQSTVVSVGNPLSSGLDVLGDQGSESSFTLRNFKLLIPGGSDNTVNGIDTGAAATISGVFVIDLSTQGRVGIFLHGGGTIANSLVSMSAEPGASTYGVEAATSGTATITDSGVGGQAGVVVAAGASASIERSSLSGGSSPALLVEDSSATIEDSLLASISNPGVMALATNVGTGPTTITGRQLTIAPEAGGTGAFARVTGSHDATVHLTDSILANPLAVSIATGQGAGATGTPLVTTDYSDYDHTTAVLYSGSYVPGPHDTSAYVDPGFGDAATNDFDLKPGSPLLDFDPTPIGVSESATDREGLPRITGGARDLGAYQHQPPTVVVANYVVPVGSSASYVANGSEARPDDPLSYRWAFDDGGTGSGRSVTHTFSTVGHHTATVTATDQLGFSATATATATVTVTIGSPHISKLRETHSSFRIGSKLASTSRRRHRPPVGTTFSFSLDQPAKLTLAFVRRRGRHRAVSAGLIHVRGQRGTMRVRFYGRLSRHKVLAPGTYMLVLTATNTAGRTSTPASIRFKTVR